MLSFHSSNGAITVRIFLVEARSLKLDVPERLTVHWKLETANEVQVNDRLIENHRRVFDSVPPGYPEEHREMIPKQFSQSPLRNVLRHGTEVKGQ